MKMIASALPPEPFQILDALPVLDSPRPLGRSGANAALAKLKTATPPGTSPVWIDLSQVEATGASFFRDCFIAYRDWLKSNGRLAVFGDANEVVLDEAELAAEVCGTAVVFASRDRKNHILARVIGPMDQKVRSTLALLIKLKEADAKTLADKGAESTGQTVWHNRLATLSDLGLVTETKVGRSRIFSPIFQEMSLGT